MESSEFVLIRDTVSKDPRGVVAELEARHVAAGSDPSALFLLGVGYFKTGNFRAAEQVLMRSVTFDSNNAYAHYYLGLAKERQSKFREAMDSIRVAIRLQPDVKFTEKLATLEAQYGRLPDTSSIPPNPRPEVGSTAHRAPQEAKDSEFQIPRNEEEWKKYEEAIRRKNLVDQRAGYRAQILGLPWWAKAVGLLIIIFIGFGWYNIYVASSENGSVGAHQPPRPTSASATEVFVPNVHGQSQSNAERQLRSAGLRVGKVTKKYSQTVDSGLVIRTQPPAASKVKLKTRVSLVVSRGPKPVEDTVAVPNVVGKTESAARAQLQDLGFVVSTTTWTGGTPGLVTAQKPKAGREATKGSTVTITVSAGGSNGGDPSVTMPNVVGMTESQALAQLGDLGFAVSITTGSGGPPGLVIEQKPKAGIEATKGSTVTIIVSAGEGNGSGP